MADRDTAPYLAQDAKEVTEVVRIMNEHARRGKGSGGFNVRKKNFVISGDSGLNVDSWQCQDYDYKKPDLPIYARGLFTQTVNGNAEIAVRGYDKFFNVEEVNKTRWRNIENNTRGPYELSVKENGCIIFIAGLTDEDLIVTSKHSTGPRGDAEANHALVGERWIDMQLSALGRTRADLAKTLRRMNATAVAELCDDDFEEHVLEYTAEQAGLYLHGINLNLPEFATYPGKQVDKFADEWGFKKVQYVMKDTIEEVKPFLEDVGETGNYGGRDTEGFVIRCQARENEGSPWQDWFFKYKFEEPYLMYRQWRECTKQVISNKPPRYKKHKKITEEYLFYARQQLAQHPELGKQYNLNHGIIAMRNGFLKENGLKGSDIIRSERANSGTEAVDTTQNVLLVPIATIGCGKTTVAIALTRLFEWGHEQNDNVQGKGNRPARFVNSITASMAKHPVVVADRNNHQRRERQQIIDDVHSIVPDVKFVALHYVHSRANYGNIRKVMQDRVLSRGDNHQTIQAGSKSTDEIVGIMDGFMKRFEPADSSKSPDDGFDLIIDLDVTKSSRENLETVISQLHTAFPKLFEMPSGEDMDRAIESALNDYKPDIKHDLGKGGKEGSKPDKQPKNTNSRQPREVQSKPRPIEYFGITLSASRILAIIDAVFSSADTETARFYNHLVTNRRVQQTFHVTLMHRASSSQYPDYWKHLCDQPGAAEGGELANARVQLESVVWDDRLMAIAARLPDEGGFKSVNEVAHITIGTASEAIKPKESNDLLGRWLKGGEGAPVRELKIKGHVVLDGTIKAVLSNR